MHIPIHVSALFIALVFGIGFIILITVYAGTNRLGLPESKKGQYFIGTVLTLLTWLTFTFIFSATDLPQKINNIAETLLILMLPPVILLAVVFWVKPFSRLLATIDVHWLIYIQSFRILLELLFLMLYRYKALPDDAVMGSRNFDLLIGATAPFVAWYCFKQKKGAPVLVIVWNLLGIGALLHILVAITTTYSPLAMGYHSQLIFSFPFIWSPAFSIPLALFLHILAIKKVTDSHFKPALT